MRLTINDEIREFTHVSNLSELVKVLELPTAGIAIAVNERVVPRKTWQAYTLQENDAVFIIRATHGG